jgi:AcrR family transcriptional regulator
MSRACGKLHFLTDRYKRAKIRNVGVAKQKSAELGRPRSFNIDTALDRALQVFWKKGYEGASLSELTRTMRINRPSLYAAFGGKESLFRRALDRYMARATGYWQDAIEAPTIAEFAQRLLHGAAEAMSRTGTPGGCLLVQGALTCSADAEPVRRELAARRQAGELAIRDRLKRAKNEGDLPAEADPATLARYLTAVMQGMAVQAAGGASRSELRRVADTALRSWSALIC